MTPRKYHIRWMIRRDMAEVLAIERESFQFAWYESDFVRCLRQKNCIGMVIEHDQCVVGFMIYHLHKSRLELLNVAVGHDYRRQGVGRAMILKLTGKLAARRRERIVVHVSDANLGAQLFFRQHGFVATRVLRSFYEANDDDCYRMEYRLQADEPGETLVPARRESRK